MKENGLTHMRQAWLDAYLGEAKFNATEAARIAGYKNPSEMGYRLRKVEEIQEAIKVRLDAMTMTAEEVLAKEDEIARFDVSKYLDTEGRLTGLKLQDMIDDGYGHLVTGIKQTKYGSSIEWESPSAARDRLLKARGAYKQNVDVTQSGDVTIRIVEIDGADS